MIKGPKSRLSFLSSFQICRPKDPSFLVKSPMPAAAVSCLFSTINSKSFDISFPVFPDPPPPTPYHSSFKRNNTGSSKITPLGSESSCSRMNNKLSSPAYSEARKEYRGQQYNSGSTSTSDSNGKALPITPSRNEKNKGKTKPKASNVDTSIPLANVDETDDLYPSPLRDTSSHEFNNAFRSTTIEESLNGINKQMKQISVRTQRFKRYGSKDWKDSIKTAPEKEPWENMPNSRRLGPCMVDGKVNQSFVVVKRSVDPFEDFKKSMLEMIMEKQIFEPEHLEQLLMRFLSLNARAHHKVILEAFTEIWKELFCGS